MNHEHKENTIHVAQSAIIFLKALNRRAMLVYDLLVDFRITGRSLVKTIHSPFSKGDTCNGVGSTDSQSTSYATLKRVFNGVEITARDTFIDVGCGKGRVLAFLLWQKCPCELWGVELIEKAGQIAKEWTAGHDNVHVVIGDAFDMDYDRFTVMFMARPFLPKTFLAFIELIEAQLTHSLTLVYWVDQQSGYLLHDRPGWTVIRHGSLYKVHGFKVAGCPQGWSVWGYEPVVLRG